MKRFYVVVSVLCIFIMGNMISGVSAQLPQLYVNEMGNLSILPATVNGTVTFFNPQNSTLINALNITLGSNTTLFNTVPPNTTVNFSYTTEVNSSPVIILESMPSKVRRSRDLVGTIVVINNVGYENTVFLQKSILRYFRIEALNESMGNATFNNSIISWNFTLAPYAVETLEITLYARYSGNFTISGANATINSTVVISGLKHRAETPIQFSVIKKKRFNHWDVGVEVTSTSNVPINVTKVHLWATDNASPIEESFFEEWVRPNVTLNSTTSWNHSLHFTRSRQSIYVWADIYAYSVFETHENSTYFIAAPSRKIEVTRTQTGGGGAGGGPTSGGTTGGGLSATPQSCYDGIQNQGETGIDCGGPCLPCLTCYDGIQNHGETSIDCGGPCDECMTCYDGIQNQGELGIDCGGPCPPCLTCYNGVQDNYETGVDCGGPCLPCDAKVEPVLKVVKTIEKVGNEGYIITLTVINLEENTMKNIKVFDELNENMEMISYNDDIFTTVGRELLLYIPELQPYEIVSYKYITKWNGAGELAEPRVDVEGVVMITREFRYPIEMRVGYPETDGPFISVEHILFLILFLVMVAGLRQVLMKP